MHYYKGNRSKSPYICIKFVPLNVPTVIFSILDLDFTFFLWLLDHIQPCNYLSLDSSPDDKMHNASRSGRVVAMLVWGWCGWWLSHNSTLKFFRRLFLDHISIYTQLPLLGRAENGFSTWVMGKVATGWTGIPPSQPFGHITNDNHHRPHVLFFANPWVLNSNSFR